jgi:transposase
LSDLVKIEKDATISKLLDDFQRLENRIVSLEKDNFLLKKENEILQGRLSHYENPKNSRNSSVPPSKDENRPKKNQSLRKSTGNKVGGQPGRKGCTLEMTAFPDNVVELYPEFCCNCGFSLENVQAILDKSRQIVDIPPINAVWTEYRTYRKNCNCGCNTTSNFPEGVKSPISYGSNIESLIGYFHARQYLPYSRMKEMMSDVFNLNISEGGLHYLLNRFANKTAPFYEMIRQRVSNSKVIGTDETGAKVNGNKHWFWTWQTLNLT